MPVYNTASTLERAINSVLNQKGSLKILLTIINDGSPDNSYEILNKYKSVKGIEIITQENRGFSGARNTGLQHIKGKFITFLDSDDWLTENALDNMYKAAEKYGSTIVQGSFYSVTKKNKRLHLVKDKPTYGEIFGFPWGKLFKAEIFSNICFPERYWFEDTIIKELILPTVNKDKITSIASPTYNYLMNPKGITANAKKNLKVLDTIWISKKIWESRQTLGHRFKNDEYVSFLRQNIMNINRIESYGDRTITELAFFAIKELKNQFFPTYEIPTGPLRYLDMALENNKIKNFIFIAGLLK